MASASSCRRFACLTLIVMTLFVRMLAPEGWMPRATAAGGIELTLCNGMGGETVIVTADGKVEHHKSDPGQHADHPCAFAGVGIVDTASPPPIPDAPAPALGVAPSPIATAIVPGRGLAAPPPPATGPPALA